MNKQTRLHREKADCCLPLGLLTPVFFAEEFRSFVA